MVRHEVFAPDVNVDTMHPQNIYQQELSLAKDFAQSLSPASKNIDPCPVCGSQRHEVMFEKWGQLYAICPKTWTLSLGNMPSQEILHTYHTDSNLARYRSSNGYQDAMSEHRQLVWDTQIDWLSGRISRYRGKDKNRVLDIGARMAGWVEAVKHASFVEEYFLADPLPPLEASNSAVDCDVVMLFDVLQRYSDPVGLLVKAFKALKPGGILLLTSRSGSGFDILSLAGESESVFPLDHIVLPSPQGMSLALQQAGFEVLELTTPGHLDVQLVKQAQDQIPLRNFFQRYLISQNEEKVYERLQAFLQQNNLSSHMRVVAKKPE